MEALNFFVMFKKLVDRFTIILCITTLSNTVKGQSIDLFAPIAIPVAISGSFAEIRTDHFHSGVDFRTNGKAGLKVYSSDTGFVSRIKVSPIGFGKTIYIEHPNGITTVYAHLDKFEGKIARYVESAQYAQKSFEVELFPTKDELIVKKGEIIGISGNSGSSGGPHLHYEVRHTSSQAPISPLKYFKKWDDTDTAAPAITSLYLYKIDSIGILTDSITCENIKVTRKKNYYWATDTVYAYGEIGLGIESFDFFNEQSNRCGFSKISLSVNEQPTYALNLDSFAFSETKFVNSIIDYKSKIISGNEIVQLWIDANNKFSCLNFKYGKGTILVEDDNVYNITIKVYDQAENTSTLKMIIKGRKASTQQPNKNSLSSGILLEFNKEHKLTTDEYEIVIPKDAFYHNILFSHKSDFIGKTNQKVFQIHNAKTPIHKRYTLRVKNNNVPKAFQSKTYIGYLNGKGIEYCDSKFLNGHIETTCSKLGNYVLAIDTVPPVIKPKNLWSKANLSNESIIKLLLYDETGISTYTGYIDGQWVLFEWDPKTDSLTYRFDKKRLKQKAWHKLELKVADRLDNKSEYSCEFFW